MKIIIPGEFPTMNEIVKASKSHYMQYANMKKEYTGLVEASARDLPKVRRANFKVEWYCKNRMKDPDNISGGGIKFILDGLVQAGVLENDGWRQIKGISHDFIVDKDNPRVEVVINEI